MDGLFPVLCGSDNPEGGRVGFLQVDFQDEAPCPKGQLLTAAQQASLAVADHLRWECGHPKLGWPVPKPVLPCPVAGKSVALSAVVATLARIIGMPLPDDLAATGTWHDGRLGPVELATLPSKLNAAREWGYRRILVVKGQEGELPPDVELLRVSPEVSRALLELPQLIWHDRADEALARMQVRWDATTGKRDPVVGDLLAVRDFVGRKAQLRTVRKFLQRGCPFTVIVGPAGFGKTYLVNKVLDEVVKDSHIPKPGPKGIMYIDCRSPAPPLPRLFEAAGRIAGKIENFHDALSAHDLSTDEKLAFFFKELGKVGRVWVILDNLESLLCADGTFTDPELERFAELTVARRLSIQIVATSHAVPRFTGDRNVAVVRLDEGLSDAEAVRYLRGQSAIRDVKRLSRDFLRDLAGKVHCVPLGLASLVDFLSRTGHAPSAILQDSRLLDQYDREDRTKVLISGQVRQQTPKAQLVLAAVSVFFEPTPEAALRSILPELDDLDALLWRLERNGLLRRRGEHYDMHQTVREIVHAQLPCEGQYARRTFHTKAGQFYLTLSEAIKAAQRGAPRRSWPREAQLGWAKAVASAGEHLWAAEAWDDLVRNYAKLHEWCIALRDWGRFRENDTLCQRVLRAARAVGEPRVVAVWLHEWAVRNQEVGNYTLAEQCCAEGLEMAPACAELGMVEGHLWDRRGRVAYATGNHALAQEYFAHAAEIKGRLNAQAEVASSRSWIGVLLAEEGQFTEAMDLLGRCYEIAIRDAASDNIALAVGRRWGRVLRRYGDYPGAEKILSEIAVVARRMDVRPTLLWILVELGHLARIGRVRQPLSDIVRGIEDVSLPLDYLWETPHILLEIGLVNHAAGRLGIAARYYQQCLDTRLGYLSAGSLVRFGILRLQEGDVQQGAVLLEKGATGNERLMATGARLYDPVYDLALAQVARGLVDQAVETYQSAVKKCTARGVVDAALADLRLLEGCAADSPGYRAAVDVLEGARNAADRQEH
jgi:tetratricopeptide (TPR) repeat protein